jgi:prepilin-type N-terminal cleavage/methylation domain-containing protein
MRNIANRKPKRAGFTLIELLVVIAIVAIIAAILFPVFATVRERGRRTVCQSNLKQIALAMQQYVQDNGGIYPPSPIFWADAPYSYVKDASVFQCPDHLSADRDVSFGITTDPTASNNGRVDYTYDLRRLSVFLPPLPSKNSEGVHESTFTTPSAIWLNVDSLVVAQFRLIG